MQRILYIKPKQSLVFHGSQRPVEVTGSQTVKNLLTKYFRKNELEGSHKQHVVALHSLKNLSPFGEGQAPFKLTDVTY